MPNASATSPRSRSKSAKSAERTGLPVTWLIRSDSSGLSTSVAFREPLEQGDGERPGVFFRHQDRSH